MTIYLKKDPSSTGTVLTVGGNSVFLHILIELSE